MKELEKNYNPSEIEDTVIRQMAYEEVFSC